MSNVKDKCLYCDKECFMNYIGKHIFENHHNDLVKDLTKQSTEGLIEMPISIGGFQFCLITKKIWKKPTSVTTKTRAVKHMENEQWSKENQLKELYRLTGTSPESGKKVFIDYDYSKKQSDENKALDLSIAKLVEKDLIITQLRAEVAELQKALNAKSSHDKQCEEVKRIADEIRNEIAITKKAVEQKMRTNAMPVNIQHY